MNIPSRINPLGYDNSLPPGNDNSLPPGYLPAYFWESTSGQSISTGVVKTWLYKASLRYSMNESSPRGALFGYYYDYSVNILKRGKARNCVGIFSTNGFGDMARYDANYAYNLVASYNNDALADYNPTQPNEYVIYADAADHIELNGKRIVPYKNEAFGNNVVLDNPSSKPITLLGTDIDSGASGIRLYNFKTFTQDVADIDLVPAIDPDGIPCMLDLLTGTPRYNKYITTSYVQNMIIGFTMKQARKLHNLSAADFNIALPSGWQDDSGVVSALDKLTERGCVLRIREYDYTAATSAYSMRRVWVKRIQLDYGNYVDADGTRWHIRSFDHMLGGDPEEHGYERFRSVDAAVEYWGLTRYVAPEPEEPEEAAMEIDTIEEKENN